MLESRSVTRERIGERISRDSLLGDLLLPLPNVVGRRKPGLRRSFEQMARMLRAPDRAALVQFAITAGETDSSLVTNPRSGRLRTQRGLVRQAGSGDTNQREYLA